MLKQAFNATFYSNEYDFVPEQITEGGILWKNWPNKKEYHYKSMRVYLNRYPVFNQGEFGKIPLNIHIQQIGKEVDTRLKSFYQAPLWTALELEIFADCLETIGLVPRARSFKQIVKRTVSKAAPWNYDRIPIAERNNSSV
jgi:hypothetical protein